MKRDPKKNLMHRLVATGYIAVALTSSMGCRGLNHWCNKFQGCVSKHTVDDSNRVLGEKAGIREKHLPEVLTPEAIKIVALAEPDGASLTIESPSDQVVASPVPAAPFKQPEVIKPSTRQLDPHSSGLQQPSSTNRTATPTVSAQPVPQVTGSLPIAPATDSGELSFTFE